VNRRHAVETPVDLGRGIAEQNHDTRVFPEILKVLPTGALPVRQRFVVEDHRASLKADVGLAGRR
jgi:hypothetical protein